VAGGAIVLSRTVWTIFFQPNNVSDHHKSISEEQKTFSFWGLRPQTPTKHFVHGLAIIFNACEDVVSRSNSL